MHPKEDNVKTCNTCLRALSRDQFHRASKEKDGLQHKCIACAQAYQAAWRTANHAQVKAKDVKRGMEPKRKAYMKRSAAALYKANRDAVLERTAAYHKAHPEVHKKAFDKWRRRNLAYMAQSVKEWRQRHPGKQLVLTRRYTMRKLQAYPIWADDTKIKAVYAEARRLTRSTGVPHHVDHIVPISSKIVCGLHNEFNLQPLPWRENIAKGNRHWPDMPGID